MKNILLIRTGGTICSSAQSGGRIMDKKSSEMTTAYLVQEFKKSDSPYSAYEIEDAKLSVEYTTLSESMTLDNLSEVVKLVLNTDLTKYAGIVVLHGTDTLAYTSALFSFAFAGVSVPIVLVAGNKPPMDEGSNANANFKCSVELIWSGLAPNVYVTYRNSDGVMRLYLGSTLMQCDNFSEDFYSSKSQNVFEIGEDIDGVLKECKTLSNNRKPSSLVDLSKVNGLTEKVLFIRPYTGLDYSIYETAVKGCKGVLHGTYHSGTVSWPGLVLEAEIKACRNDGELEKARKYEELAKKQVNSSKSIGYLARLCKENGVSLFIAPSTLGDDQYETMNVVKERTDAVLINMTSESAYAKLILAISCALTSEQTVEYMTTAINNEI